MTERSSLGNLLNEGYNLEQIYSLLVPNGVVESALLYKYFDECRRGNDPYATYLSIYYSGDALMLQNYINYCSCLPCYEAFRRVYYER